MKFQKIVVNTLLKLLSKLNLRQARWLGRVLGSIVWRTDSGPKKSTLRNLELAYPDMNQADRDLLAKRSLQHMFSLLPEFAITWNASSDWLQNQVQSIQGEALLACPEGKGVIILAPHLGNWEAMGQIIATKVAMTAMYAPPKQAFLEPIVRSARERFGVNMVPATAKGVIGLTRALKKNESVFILPDQVPDGTGGIHAPFFNVNAFTMKLAAGLISRTGCKVVMAAGFQSADGWNIVLEEADPEIYSEDVHTSVAAMNRSVEKLVSYHPEQYQWEYKRFRKLQDPSIHYYRF
ncbi:lysophospholipid acyltransferase family protein [Umboniibacter marinipuniceus]|uniref:KDO2-lipid IV(A) lauroyltransferase n=1 Tax=Umboniibacter marinipuniceus TaxID=569599 RepID=A0A3M0AHA3_9GAMM|nr:lysophospholipid acyltransferase family protein [Umboniibacter marinipuniceus]RMA82138.1 KDO2-lipid IV(A) lauroyltransferase [Umboniibacter marinipuniceus]